MTFGCLLTHTSTPVKNDQPVKKSNFWRKNAHFLQRTSQELLNRFSKTWWLSIGYYPNCVALYVSDLCYKPFQSYSRFADTDSSASAKRVQMTRKTIINLTFSLKMNIFIVLTVIGSIPDLKIWLLTGIGLSSGDLLSFEFSLFFGLFSGFFLCFFKKRCIDFNFRSLQGFLTSFDVTFHDLIATRREIIYGHTWSLDQQKYFFEKSTIEI